MRTPDWVECNEPGWSLSFRYPTTDVSGRTVIVERHTLEDQARQSVHVMAEDKDEIYFEVVRLVGVTAAEAYSLMRERMPGLYPDVVFEPLVVNGDVLEASFAWANQTRSIQFLEHSDATYRVIFRPMGAENLRILRTLRGT